jgi:hypothetical protein
VPLTNPDPTKTTSYRLARAAVIILGVLLAFAFVLLVVGLIWRMTGHKSATETQEGPARFTLPPGTRIISLDFQPGHLILHARSPQGEEVDIFDTDTGRLVGQVKVPQAGAK